MYASDLAELRKDIGGRIRDRCVGQSLQSQAAKNHQYTSQAPAILPPNHHNPSNSEVYTNCDPRMPSRTCCMMLRPFENKARPKSGNNAAPKSPMCAGHCFLFMKTYHNFMLCPNFPSPFSMGIEDMRVRAI